MDDSNLSFVCHYYWGTRKRAPLTYIRISEHSSCEFASSARHRQISCIYNSSQAAQLQLVVLPRMQLLVVDKGNLVLLGKVGECFTSDWSQHFPTGGQTGLEWCHQFILSLLVINLTFCGADDPKLPKNVYAFVFHLSSSFNGSMMELGLKSTKRDKKENIKTWFNGVANPWILHLAQIGQEAIGITLDSHDIVGLNTGLIFKDLVHAAALLATQTMGLPCRSDNAELAVYVSSLSWLDVCCVFSCWRANIWMLFVIRCGHKAFS